MIEEEVYREKPQSFVVYEKDSHGYRLLRQSLVGFRGCMKLGLVTERDHEALLSGLTQYEMSLMEGIVIKVQQQM